MSGKITPIAPVYRYFTADLLTNEILAEVPFREVTIERALKAAGKMSGRIPVTAETDSIELYENTIPGQTALYVVRNGVCIWGGIIWDRSYRLTTKDMEISASEFTSYFYHRNIWKTWNHQYGASVVYDQTNGWRVIFDYGSSALVKGGSTVKLEFYDPTDFKYNGYYRVANTPSPTTDVFSLVGGFAVADLVSSETTGNYIYFYTKENHGYQTGDSVTITITAEAGVALSSPEVAEFVIEAPGGAASNMFRVAVGSTPNVDLMPVDGTVGRTLPTGNYPKVTVTVRQDAYDYIRTLIDSTFEDFIGPDFPNVYIEPGVSYNFNVINKTAMSGYCIIEMDRPHGMAPGQAIQIQDVDNVFDGEYEVTDTPSPTVVVYARGGNVPSTAVAPIDARVVKVSMVGGLATLTTQNPHGFSLGQNITVEVGGAYPMFDGVYPILDIPTATTVRYKTEATSNIAEIILHFATAAVAGDPSNEVARASVTNNVVTLELKDPVVFSPGDSVVIDNVYRDLQIAEKSLDASNNLAMIKTTEDHALAVGHTVVISGLDDVLTAVSKTTTTGSVTVTTEAPHNLKVGNSITVGGTDEHIISGKSLSSNVGTITTALPHNVPAAAEITVVDLKDSYTVVTKRLLNGAARLTTSSPHNIKVNDALVVTGIRDVYTITTKQVSEGLVTLTTSLPHNILIGDKITIAGVGVPYDGTEIEVSDITATRIMYNVDEKYAEPSTTVAVARSGTRIRIGLNSPLSKTGGTATVENSFYNGEWIATAVTSNTVEYYLPGEDQLSASVGSAGRVSAPSVLNGTAIVADRTSNTLSFSRTGSNMGFAAVAPPASEDELPAIVTLDTVHKGVRTVTGVTPNTFTFSQSLPSAVTSPSAITATRPSIFNGTRTVTAVPTTDRFSFSLPGYTAPILEEPSTNIAFARATNLYNGTFTINAVDDVYNTISYNRTLPDSGSKAIQTRGDASVRPVAVISTFGPFPGNADIGMGFSAPGYTGINIDPIAYRGYELKTVGAALDAYSDNINGFEYRIDCSYDPGTNKFLKTFVMLPINFPNPPPPGEASPITRFGADKLVFEYPGGSIIDVTIEESAEESATRFFAVGETDLGPDVGPDIGIASSDDLLRGDRNGRRWPLLDATENIDNVQDEETLYGYAQRYLSEAAPPYTTLTVSVNGSISPFVGSYAPGDWCALILDDPFIKMRLQSDLEPRSDVIVRKIDSFKITVPPGVTFPETVTLSLVAEWEVDKRG